MVPSREQSERLLTSKARSSNESMYQRMTDANVVSPCLANASTCGSSSSTSRRLLHFSAAERVEKVIVSWWTIFWLLRMRTRAV